MTDIPDNIITLYACEGGHLASRAVGADVPLCAICGYEIMSSARYVAEARGASDLADFCNAVIDHFDREVTEGRELFTELAYHALEDIRAFLLARDLRINTATGNEAEAPDA